MGVEKLLDKVTTLFTALVLSSNLGCAGIQKDVRADLTGTEIGCEILQQNKGKSFQCGHLTYNLVNRSEYGGMINTTYHAIQGDNTYTLKTDQMENESCIYALKLQGPKGKPIKLFFNKCKQMK